ncbi:MAG: hypothetical protein HY774_29780 [Acidobacteria bacterium]|nr:hypothetical protein [Acidobacteriota bacterium]
MNRKLTTWRKNRKLGDVAGGRKWPKIEDWIINREHPLRPPVAGDNLPLLIEENPSRDFFFPVTAQEMLACLKKFPKSDTHGITHLWFKRLKKKALLNFRRPLAEYIAGSGVYVIVLYPWPKDMLLRFGPHRPSTKILRSYARWTTELIHQDGGWFLRWDSEPLRDFYLNGLLGHEIGHHQDPKLLSKANARHREETAEQYALQWIALTSKW